MTSDELHIAKLPLEESARWRWRRLLLTVGLTTVVCFPGFALLVHDQEARRTAGNAFWEVEGTPCAPLAAERFRDVQRAPSRTNYDGVLFERHGGAMTCTHRNDRIGGVALRYPICKFNAPDYLAVSVAGQERFYDLTLGRAAAVRVVNGQVRCVLTPNFEM
ncbi:hypothetical protein [Caulobacter segnis]|uniref:hypothetical protein n=1 Tax=Caulobacter segnis TaxID=88688 RepID=UPI002858F934|nr:hypothetical protein [Caulobacter segnis]MDR6626447.1 hypothetical protein [Caulobacter segnis]